MPNFYPRAQVNLTFRLDDPAIPRVPLRVPAGWKLAATRAGELLAGGNSDPFNLGEAASTPIPDNVFHPRVRSIGEAVDDLVDIASKLTSGVSRAIRGAVPVGSIRAEIIPDSVRINYASSDLLCEGEFVLNYKSFPVDFRNIASCDVECFLGVAWSIDGPFAPSLSAPDSASARLMFRGTVDQGTWTVLDDTVEMKARDETQVLLDTKWSGEKITWDKPLDELVADVLAKNPGTSKFKVELRGVGLRPRVEAKVRLLIPAVFRGEAGGQEMTAEKDWSVWDTIWSLADSIGFMPWVEDRTVILAPKRTLRVDNAVKPLLVWGRNLSALEVKRFYNAAQAPAVRVSSWSVTLRETIEAVYPVEAAPEVTGSGEDRVRPMRDIRLRNIDDRAELARLAKVYYERQARLDVQLTLETDDPYTAEGAELLGVRPGRVIQVFFSDEEREVLHSGVPVSERVQRLVALGFKERVAKYIADSYEWLAHLYSVHVAEFTYERETGFSLHLEATREMVSE